MFVILLALWLIFAGKLTLMNLLLGALVAGLVTLFCARFLGYDSRRFYRGLVELPDALRYLALLLREMVREGFEVIGWIWRRKKARSAL